jgi:hypothetical protein
MSSTWKVQRVEWNFFNECIELIGGVDTSAGLSFDVPRRWNSTYLMLENASRYRIVFSSLSIHDDNFKRPKIWFMEHLILFPICIFCKFEKFNVFWLKVWKTKSMLLKQSLLIWFWKLISIDMIIARWLL